MHETPLPVDAVTGDARHRDVRAEVFAVIPQRRATLGTRLFLRVVLIAARFPAYSAAWASLAERAYAQGDPVTAYAYARTGYHRGLDQLRRAGWKGHGPVPWEHEPNRGFLRALYMLGASAAAIGEDDEAERCAQFLRDSSPTAAETLGA